METINAEGLEHAKKTVQSLSDINFSDTDSVEVQLDSVASALLDLKGASKSKKKPRTLSEVLAALMEDGEIVSSVEVNIADEIAKLIRTKDYEGYSEDYIERRLESLVSDLQDELESSLKNLQSKADQ